MRNLRPPLTPACPFLLAALVCSCAHAPQRPSLSFEAQPRPLIAELGGAGTRFPKVAVSSSGMLTALVLREVGGDTRLEFTMSHDGGDRFTAPATVSLPGTSVQSHGENSPLLAITPTTIHAVWEQTGADGGTELMSARSLTYGRNFERPVRVTDDQAAGFRGFASLAASSNGDVYVAWLDGREADAPQGTFALYIARSQDGGTTFGKNQRIALGACPCCRPQVVVGSSGDVYVGWRRVFDNDVRDMVVSTSRDQGESFAPDVRVADDGWQLKGCPHSGPAMVENRGRLYLSWLTEGRDRRPRLQLAWSDDRAAHFQEAVEVSRDTLDANHPTLAASEDGRVVLVFQARDGKAGGGWKPLSPFVAEIVGNAVSNPFPVPTSEHATASYAYAACGTGGRLYVVWTQHQDESTIAAISRGRFAGVE